MTAERRKRLLEVLEKRRFDTRTNLANELGVSLRTIENDIVGLILMPEKFLPDCKNYIFAVGHFFMISRLCEFIIRESQNEKDNADNAAKRQG